MTRKKRPLGGSTVSWQRETSIVVEKETPGAVRLIGYFVPHLQRRVEVEAHSGGRHIEHLAGFCHRIFSSYCSGFSFRPTRESSRGLLPEAGGSVFLSAMESRGG